MTALALTPAVVMRVHARTVGLSRLAGVSLDDRGFELARTALDRFIERGYGGEMDFIARTWAVRRNPSKLMEGARSAIVAAVAYRGQSSGIARYAQSADYHSVLHERLVAVVDALKDELPGVRTLVCVDTKPLMERAIAARSGLGFVGKHGCVIVPGLGSYVLLGVVLTDARWLSDKPPHPLRKSMWEACGTCRRCLEACPTDAFVGPGELDARRCISYLTIEHRGPIEEKLQDRMGQWVAGCDVCQQVCPYNASVKRESRVRADEWLPQVAARDSSPTAIAMLGSARYRAFVRGTALRRIPRRALRRNALIALGNAQGQLTSPEQQAVEKGLNDSDAQVREAAKRVQNRRSHHEP